jgi:hypothetical protein
MPAISISNVLDAWEFGLTRPMSQRADMLLRLEDVDAAGLSVGSRDAFLLDLREALFGSQVAGHCECPKCGEHMELAFTLADVRVPPPMAAIPLVVRENGWDIELRLMTPDDLDDAAAAADANDARRILLEHCVQAARHFGAVANVAELPAAVVDAVAARLAEADPQADTSLGLVCDECGHGWEVTFDPGVFLWDELTSWAVRTLDDVAQLASAFGWSERDILAMSPWRRQRYLAAVGAA